MELTARPSRNAQIRTTLLPDGFAVLMNVKTDWAVTLNPQGALVWEFCDGEHSIASICAEVGKLLPPGSEGAASDSIIGLIAELQESGLVELTS